MKKYLGLICLLPMIAGVMKWNELPTQMGIHWNVFGDIDGYGSKIVVFFIIPLIYFLLHCLIVWVLKRHSDWIGGKNTTANYSLYTMPVISLIYLLMMI